MQLRVSLYICLYVQGQIGVLPPSLKYLKSGQLVSTVVQRFVNIYVTVVLLEHCLLRGVSFLAGCYFYDSGSIESV